MLPLGYVFLTMAISFAISWAAPAPAIEWENFYDGNNGAWYTTIRHTLDNGFILGVTDTDGNANDDILLSKIDSNGTLQWARRYGSGRYERLGSVQQASDGGYVIAGRTAEGRDSIWNDAFLLRTDSEGDTLWLRKFRKSPNDNYFNSVTLTANGDIVAVGAVHYPGDSGYPYGSYDFYVVRTNPTGDTLWTRTHDVFYNGSFHGFEEAYSVCETADGGIVVAGYGSQPMFGDMRYLVVKFDSGGQVVWSSYYGDADLQNWAMSVQNTPDGGIICAGFTTDVIGNGLDDFRLVKLSSNGAMEWQRTYGYTYEDRAFSVLVTEEGGFVVAGYTSLSPGNNSDFLVVRTDAQGDILWSVTFGGTQLDQCYSACAMSDGSYAFAGKSNSLGNTPHTLVVKTAADPGLIVPQTPTVAANASEDGVLLVWNRVENSLFGIPLPDISYQIFRADSATGPFSYFMSSVDTFEFVDTPPDYSNQSFFQIIAVRGSQSR